MGIFWNPEIRGGNILIFDFTTTICQFYAICYGAIGLLGVELSVFAVSVTCRHGTHKQG